MKWSKVKNVPGTSNGKSKLASMMAKNMYQPKQQVMKAVAPAVICSLPARAVAPLLSWKYAPVRQAKVMTSQRKMLKKTMLVRIEQIM